MSILVSIIIPHFNSAALLKETIASVSAQTYQNWEIIIVDDRSDEKEFEEIESYQGQQVRLFKRQGNNKGPSACRNEGFRLSKGELIIFLDADDLLEPFCLQQRVVVMEATPFPDWAVFRQYQFKTLNKQDKKIFSAELTRDGEAVEKFLQMDPPWQTMASIWRRSALERLQGFDESLIVMEDPDLHLRALLDEHLSVSIAFELPPDSFYRLDPMSEEKKLRFYDQSIRYRFVFLYKQVRGVNKIENKTLLHHYRRSLHRGYFQFLKNFLLYRLNNYKKDFSEINSFLVKWHILNLTDLIKLRIAGLLFSSESAVLRKLKIRGFFYKLLS